MLNDSEILFDEKEGNDLIEASLDGEEALGKEKSSVLMMVWQFDFCSNRFKVLYLWRLLTSLRLRW